MRSKAKRGEHVDLAVPVQTYRGEHGDPVHILTYKVSQISASKTLIHQLRILMIC